MAYGWDKGGIHLWKKGEEFPGLLYDSMLREDFEFIAHNAAFEFLIWNFVGARKYGWPRVNIKRFDCTMAEAIT